MTDEQNKSIRDLVYKFAGIANITDQALCEEYIQRLANTDIDRAIDILLVSINGFLNRGMIKTEDVFSNADLLLALNPEKYKSTDDLIARLRYIQSMNIEYQKMPLDENHRLTIEAFDAFNQLSQNQFDCFYTGGLMGYLATDTPLSRYHGDLDLFINEQQLEALETLVSQSPDFTFVSNMDHKEKQGHEFKLVYKDTPMSIGLFLFERTPENGIIIKEYFHENGDPHQGLFVNKTELSPECARLTFSDEVRTHNGIPYTMQSLEAIYASKEHSRPKDRRDAEVMKPHVDFDKLEALKKAQLHDSHSFYQHASDSVVSKMEQKMKRRSERTRS